MIFKVPSSPNHSAVLWLWSWAHFCSKGCASVSVILQKHLLCTGRSPLYLEVSFGVLELWHCPNKGPQSQLLPGEHICLRAKGRQLPCCEGNRSQTGWALREFVSLSSPVTSTLPTAFQLAETFQSRAEGSGTAFHSPKQKWAATSIPRDKSSSPGPRQVHSPVPEAMLFLFLPCAS